MAVKTLFIRAGRWLLISIAVLLLILILFFVLFRTGPGTEYLARLLESGLSAGQGRQIKIGKISGNLPFQIRCDSLSISDEAGEWLLVEGVYLDWRPLALLKGRIHIIEADASDVSLARLPQASHEGGGKGVSIPQWPPHIPPLHIEQFQLERIHLSKALTGVDAVFSMRSNVVVSDPVPGLKGSIRLERMDRAGTYLEVGWSLKGEKPYLILDATARDAEDGLVRSIFGLRETGPVFMDLKGEGPLNEWKGRLKAGAEKIGRIDSSLEFTGGTEGRVKGDGLIKLDASLVPEKLSTLVRGREISFSLDTEYGKDGILMLHHAGLAAGEINIGLSGKFDLKKRLMAAGLNSEIPDISAFGGLLGRKVGGKLHATGTLTGPFDRPLSEFTFSLQDPVFEDMAAKKMTAEIRVETTEGSIFSLRGLKTRGKGVLEGLPGEIRGLELPVRQVKWSFDSLFSKGNPITVNSLEVTGGGLLLRFSGHMDPEALFIDGNAALESGNLGWLSGFFDREIQGRAGLTARLRADFRSLDLSSEIQGRINGLRIPNFPAAMLEDGLSFGGKIDLHEGRYLDISDFNMGSSGARLSGNCSINLSDGNTEAKAGLFFPRLSALSGAIGRKLEGELRLDLEIKGPYRDPSVSATGKGKGLIFEGVEIQEADIALKVEEPIKRPHGNFNVVMRQAGHLVRAGTGFSLEGNNLALRDIFLSSQGASLTGSLETDLKEIAFTGTLRGGADDLKSLSSLIGESVEGSARMEVSFSRGERGQDAALNFQVNGLVSRFGNAGQLTLNATVRDLFKDPEGGAELELGSLKRGDLDIQSVRFKAEGGLRNSTFMLKGSGSNLEGFDLMTLGTCSISGEGVVLRFDRLEGNLGKYPVVMKRPLVFKGESGNYSIEKADFSLGPGSLLSSITVGKGSMAIDLGIEGIPLEILKLAGFPPLAGTGSARINVSGRRDRPEGTVEVQIKAVKSEISTLQEIPPADLLLNASLKEDLLQGDIVLQGLSEKPFRADFQMPANISFAPFSFHPGQKGEIKGRVSAEVRMNRIQSYFFSEDQLLNGDLIADVDISGSLEEPRIRGDIRIRKGSYENPPNGIIVKDIDLHIKVLEDRFVIEEARATDGEKGLMTAEGWFRFLPSENFPFQVDMTLDNCALVRRDDLNLTTGGHVSASGSVKDMAVSGDFKVGRADLNIPDRLPQEVVKLDVQEINFPAQKKPEKVPSSRRPAGKVSLDVNINAPGRIFVRGRGLDSEWMGRLHVFGSATRPVIEGNLSIIRGSYNFFGKPFTLTDGVITFEGGSPPSPHFQVTGENRRSDMTARIKVSGSPSNPSVTIDSDPVMPRDEILSRLLFGKGMANITPFQALRLAQAVNALRGGGGGILNFLDRTREFIGVDQLELKQSEENIGNTSLAVGKYLKDGVYVEVEKGLGTESGSVSVEVEVTPHITVESEANADTGTGVGINWKWDY